MLGYDGFRLIGITAGSYSGLVVEHGLVQYEPEVKYRIEKRNAFDPTILIRREPYHEDTIECEAFLDAGSFDDLLTLLTVADRLWIEFDASGETLQFPVFIDKLPKLEDDNRNHRGQVKITLTSIYNTLSPIDFDNLFGWGVSWGSNFGF